MQLLASRRPSKVSPILLSGRDAAHRVRSFRLLSRDLAVGFRLLRGRWNLYVDAAWSSLVSNDSSHSQWAWLTSRSRACLRARSVILALAPERPFNLPGRRQYFNTLFSERVVANNYFSFKLATSGSELYLGGADSSQYTGAITYTSVTSQSVSQQLPSRNRSFRLTRPQFGRSTGRVLFPIGFKATSSDP